MSGIVSVGIDYTPVTSKAGHLTINQQVANFVKVFPDFIVGTEALRLCRTYFRLHPEQAQGIDDKLLKATGQGRRTGWCSDRASYLLTLANALWQATRLTPRCCSWPKPRTHTQPGRFWSPTSIGGRRTSSRWRTSWWVESPRQTCTRLSEGA